MLVFVNLGTKQGLKLIKKKKEALIIMETYLGKFRYEIDIISKTKSYWNQRLHHYG